MEWQQHASTRTNSEHIQHVVNGNFRMRSATDSSITSTCASHFLRVSSYKTFVNLIQVLHSIKTPWPEFASELHRPSDRRLSATLVPTYADSRVSRGQRDGSLRPYSQLSRPELRDNSIIFQIILLYIRGKKLNV
jgi:hypothetical protein